MKIEAIKSSKPGRTILLAIMWLLSFVNQIIPKKKNRILFYDSGRNFLDDNTEAIYHWLKENGYEAEYKFIVCVPKETRKLPFSDYEPVGVLKGVIAFLTSKYVFFSFGDFRIRPSKEQIVVNQWHATPTKRIGKLTYDVNYQRERLDNFTYVVSSSGILAPIIARAFGCPEEKVIVIGNARNDYLYSNKDALHIVGIERDMYKKLILWMPTFRTSNDDRFHDGNTDESETMLPIIYKYDDLNKLDQVLSEEQILLVIKIHPMAVFKKNECQNILIVTNDDIIPKGVRLYEFVKEFDSLITDYSSVYCDYLLLDRPIGFTLDDFEAYEKTRGFVFDNFINYMPGHHIYTVNDLISYVADIASGNDKYRDARRKITPVFCRFTDGKNCERLAKAVGLVLKK